MTITVRQIRDEELVPWLEAMGTAFFIWPRDAAAAADFRRKVTPIDRSIGAFDGDHVVGTFRTFASELTLPGGAQIPVGAVTAVTVRPTHRRHGILSSMVANDAAESVARGEVASILIASEYPIYGRFGYGPATWHAKWTLRTRSATFLAEPYGTVEIATPREARPLLSEIFGAYQASQAGEITRPDYLWDVDFGLVEMPGRPRWQGSVAIHRDPEGRPDGYVRYHGEEHWDEGIPDNALIVDELHGATTAVDIDLWRYLAQMDLVAQVRAETRRPREPMQWLLSDMRAARVTGLTEMLWVRLFDVERGLSSRTYERDLDVVLEVIDTVDGRPGPAAGRYRLEAGASGATCHRTKASADLTLSIRALGSALLGGTRLLDITRAGGATEHRPGALAEADAAFKTLDDPWCSTWF